MDIFCVDVISALLGTGIKFNSVHVFILYALLYQNILLDSHRKSNYDPLPTRSI